MRATVTKELLVLLNLPLILSVPQQGYLEKTADRRVAVEVNEKEHSDR